MTIATALCLGTAIAMPALAAPCDDPVYRGFDFWLGEWHARTSAGKPHGTLRVERALDGCVIRETFKGEGSYSGETLTAYDATRKAWHQTMIGNDGILLLLEGGLRDGRMVLSGQTGSANGQPLKHRITWSPMPDGSVHQTWETARGKGQWEATKGVFSRK